LILCKILSLGYLDGLRIYRNTKNSGLFQVCRRGNANAIKFLRIFLNFIDDLLSYSCIIENTRPPQRQGILLAFGMKTLWPPLAHFIKSAIFEYGAHPLVTGKNCDRMGFLFSSWN